jgi:hydrogenase/urease accessory protein HupE
MVVSFVSVVLLGYLLSVAVPSYTLAIADLAGIIAMLVSAAVGWNYMKTHRRTPPNK